MRGGRKGGREEGRKGGSGWLAGRLATPGASLAHLLTRAARASCSWSVHLVDLVAVPKYFQYS
jgi:hypothetical protein